MKTIKIKENTHTKLTIIQSEIYKQHGTKLTLDEVIKTLIEKMIEGNKDVRK